VVRVGERGDVTESRGGVFGGTSTAGARSGVFGGSSALAGSLTGVPHLLQKREPAGRLVPQLTQKTIVNEK